MLKTDSQWASLGRCRRGIVTGSGEETQERAQSHRDFNAQSPLMEEAPSTALKGIQWKTGATQSPWDLYKTDALRLTGPINLGSVEVRDDPQPRALLVITFLALR